MMSIMKMYDGGGVGVGGVSLVLSLWKLHVYPNMAFSKWSLNAFEIGIPLVPVCYRHTLQGHLFSYELSWFKGK